MKKQDNSKKLLFEMMNKVAGMPLNEDAEHERYSQYNTDINNRLKKYAEENEPDISWVEMKNDFMKDANPYNMKSPKDAYDAYFKIVDDFLSQYGY